MVALGLTVLLAGTPARAQTNVDQAKTALDKAKADFTKAHDAYLKAMDSYAAALKTPVTIAVAPTGQRTVTFVPPQGSSFFAASRFQARLLVDGTPTGWANFTAQSKISPANNVVLKAVPTKAFAYEVQAGEILTFDQKTGHTTHKYTTTCKANLTIKDATTVTLDLKGKCAAK